MILKIKLSNCEKVFSISNGRFTMLCKSFPNTRCIFWQGDISHWREISSGFVFNAVWRHGSIGVTLPSFWKVKR